MPPKGGLSTFWTRKLGGTPVPRDNPDADILPEIKKKARTFSNGERRPHVAGQNVKQRLHVSGKPPATELLTSDPLPQVLSVGQVSYRINENPPSQLHPEIVFKTACTPIVAERMALLVASGVQLRVAAVAMGIKAHTVDQWNDFGQRDIAAGVDSAYANWWNSALMAKASCEANWIARVNEGAYTDWKAAAYLLERRFGIRWSPKAPKDKLPESTDVSGKSIAELQDMLRLLLGASLALPPPPPEGNETPDSDKKEP